MQTETKCEEIKPKHHPGIADLPVTHNACAIQWASFPLFYWM